MRRLLLLPITLFCIVLINFIIINMAPGDPVMISEPSLEGTRHQDRSMAFGTDDRYLQFREFYGLTLPILLNRWPWTSGAYVQTTLQQLSYERDTMPFKEYEALRIDFGDRARFIMPLLLQVLDDPATDPTIRRTAMRFFIRGGTRQGYVGAGLTEEEKQANRKISKDNLFLTTLAIESQDTPEQIAQKLSQAHLWFDQNAVLYRFVPTFQERLSILFFETRFFRYMSRVVHLDFGTMRNDANKSVVSEVTRRFKYSLTLSLLPMLITLVLCLTLGFIMAVGRNRWPDYFFNLLCLILYAIPIFVVAPFLIENVALHHHFPFTNTPIPLSGFTSPDSIYEQETSWQRLLDVLQHIFLPLVAIIYGTLAAQARLARTAVLEVLHQDYIRTARAKGVPPFKILFKHVGRNAAITIVTSVAGSLGVVLGGSLIVETLFGINGFGKFFYDAVINRDYNVIMFSTLAGSFLTLVGYLVADITYTTLDPRVTLE